MIRYLASADGDDLQFCMRDPVLGPRIVTQAGIYGVGTKTVDFWVAERNGSVTAAISRMDGGVTVVAEPDADLTELGLFLQTVGLHSLEGKEEIVSGLHTILGGRINTMSGMCFAGELPSEAQGIDFSPSLEEVYQLICAVEPEFAQMVPWESWYPHTSHLVRHRLGQVVVMRIEGQAVATGGVYSTGPSSGVIGGVSTLPEFRGCGYASQLVYALCRWCQMEGRKPVLLCEMGLNRFYHKLGFSTLGQWSHLALP